MILHENRLPADDSHEISFPICYFQKGGTILNSRLLQMIGGALMVKKLHSESNGTNILCLILEFRAGFLGKVSPKFPNCGVILETSTMRPDMVFIKCITYSFFNCV